MSNSIPLVFFARVLWEQYFQEMQMDGTYSDKITLRAIANIFNVEIKIACTLGQRGRVDIVLENHTHNIQFRFSLTCINNFITFYVLVLFYFCLVLY